MQINIPEIFRVLNTMTLYNDELGPRKYYEEITAEGGKASDCIECGQCESVCPQHLPIIELLKQATEKTETANFKQ